MTGPTTAACETCGAALDESGVCRRCASDPAADTLAVDRTAMAAPEDLLARVTRELANDYEVQHELGRGGMAVVYKAREVELLRPVALKVLPPETATSHSMAERFKREARLAASFDHPNIIPIYRVGQAGGIFYIAMKFIEGKGLDDIIQSQGALPIPVVQHVLRAATRALAFAHKNNVVHRDVKAANILVDQDGRVVVTDFGIARAAEDAGLTQTGLLMGTPYYMSPEQCAGHRVGQHSDQYSLGIVAFQMLAGAVPFNAATIPGIMQHHFFTPVPSLADVRKDVPKALVEWVQRALSKRPEDRFVSTDDMVEAIDAVPFTDDERKRGHQMLRDLVLGVPVPKVSAAELPPLAETQIMGPDTLAGLRQSEQTLRRMEAVRGRDRRRLVAAAVVGAAIMVSLGFVVARHSSRDETAVLGPSSGTAPRHAALGSAAGTIPQHPVLGPSASTTPQHPVLGAAGAARSPSADSQSRAPRAEATGKSREPASAASREPARSAENSGARSAAAENSAAGAAVGAPGKLRVRSVPPDADIAIDGRVVGQGVLLDVSVPAGRRRLRVSAPGYAPLDTVISVKPGETSQVGTLRLTPTGAP